MQREQSQWQHRTDAETTHIAEQLRTALNARFGSLRRVGAWWQLQGRPLDPEDWQTDLRLFMESGSGLQRVTWIDAAGKRAWSVSRDRLPDAHSFESVAPALKDLVAIVRRDKSLAVSSIFDEASGRRTVYACVPILNRGTATAYVAGLYELSEMLKSALPQMPRDYSVSIVADGREINLSGAAAPRGQSFQQTASLRLANANWAVRVRAVPDDLQSLRKVVTTFGAAVTILLSVATLLGGMAYRRSSELKEEIRERQAAEERVAVLNRDLQRQLGDFQTLLEVSPVGIAVSYDPDCRRIWINPAMASMLGVAIGQNISKTGPEAGKMRFQVLRDDQVLSPDDLPMQVACRTGKEIAGEELDILREDGGRIHTLTYTAPLFDEEGRIRGVLHASIDITQRKRAEQERNSIEQKLLRAEKFRSLALMAGGLAHDLNNLLASVIGNESLALQELPQNSEARGWIRDSLEASQKAAGLMQQLARFTGRTFYTRQFLDMSRVIADLRESMRSSVPSTIELSFNLAANLPLVGAGLVEIQQVLQNVIANSVDAIGERPGRISVATESYELSEEAAVVSYADENMPPGTYVKVVIEDTGCGMTPEIASKAFDPFFTTKFLGRGLGLAEVQGVLRAHRGAVRLESSPSNGSRLILLFPALASVSAATA
jgi:PAS domain S-box-containing protein